MPRGRSLAIDPRRSETNWRVQDVHSRFELFHHLLQLDDDDRRLRFGAALSDDGIAAYVKRIDLGAHVKGSNVGSDRIFGVYNSVGRLVAAAHLARVGLDAELGLSVLKPYRHRGLGSLLVQRAASTAMQWKVRRLFMHCLSENQAIVHLARRNGMTLERSQGETDAWLSLSTAPRAKISRP